MTMPMVKFRARAMTQKDHREYIEQVKEHMRDLDFALRCYYVSLGDDHLMTEDEKLRCLKHAFEEGLKEVDVTNKKVVAFHEKV